MCDTIPPFGLLTIAAVFVGCFAAGAACIALRRRVRIVVMIGCLAFSALSTYAYFLWYRPCSLDVRLGTFSTILSGSPGRAVIITNTDARAATIKAVVINDEFSVTKSLDSIPRGKVVDYPVTLLPGDTLNLMISESGVNSRLLPPTFQSLFPNETRLLDKHKNATKPSPVIQRPKKEKRAFGEVLGKESGGYEKDVHKLAIHTDNCVQDYRFNESESQKEERVAKDQGIPTPQPVVKDEPAKTPASKVSVPEELKRKHVELVKLIRDSESMRDEERQYWINSLPGMTAEQVQNLLDILENEQRQLAARLTTVLEARGELDAAKTAKNETNELLDKKEYQKAIAVLDNSIERDAKAAWAYRLRAYAYRQKGEQDRAIADYTKAIDLEPQAPESYNGIAWLRATCSNDAVRNGKQAVEYAAKACELTKWDNPFYFDTLAAAYAESGQFEKAVAWQEKALSHPDFAKQVSESELAQAQHRAKLFKAMKPFREP